MAENTEIEKFNKQNNINNNFINLFEYLLIWSNENGFNLVKKIPRRDFYKFCNNFSIDQIAINENIDELNLGYFDYLIDIDNNEDNYEL